MIRVIHLHPFNRKTCLDDVARQIHKAFIIIGPYGGTIVNIKAAVAPAEHVFNDSIADLALCLEHFEHFIAKKFLQIFGRRLGAFGESATAGKATISGDDMQVRIEAHQRYERRWPHRARHHRKGPPALDRCSTPSRPIGSVWPAVFG